MWDLLPLTLFLPGHSSTDAHLFSHLKLGSVQKWGGHRKYSSVSLSYVNIRIYTDIRDKEWLLSLVSYLELVDCMDRKCHEIVYMKSWPNTDSKLRTCSAHFPRNTHSRPPHLLKLTKTSMTPCQPCLCKCRRLHAASEVLWLQLGLCSFCHLKGVTPWLIAKKR